MIFLLKPKPLTITVDFSNGWIKVAKSEIKSGHVRFLEVLSIDTAKISAKELSRLVSGGAFKIRPKTILSCLSRQFVTVRFLKLPSVKELEIEKMLEFQAARQLPVSIKDMATGYKILEKTQDGYSRVMLVMVQKNILSSHFDRLKSIGLVPDSVCLSTEAISNLGAKPIFVALCSRIELPST